MRNKFSVQFGQPGDVPVPGDYNGDGMTDLAVYRPSTGQWFVRNQFTVQFGDPRRRPGSRRTTTATADRRRGLPAVDGPLVRARTSSPSSSAARGYVPVAGDYNGDGTADIALFQPSTGTWFVRNQFTVQFGDPGDRAGAGRLQRRRHRTIRRVSAVDGAVVRAQPVHRAVRRPERSARAARLQRRRHDRRRGLSARHRPVVRAEPVHSAVRRSTDIPCRAARRSRCAAAGDFNGDGMTDIAVYRPSTGQWFVRNQLAVQFGDPGDIAGARRLQRRRRMDIAVFRPSTGHWFVRNQSTVQFGDPSDMPVPGDYNGDGLHGCRGLPAVHRRVVRAQPVQASSSATTATSRCPATTTATASPTWRSTGRRRGQWFVRNILAVQFGDPGDVPIPGDYNGDGSDGRGRLPAVDGAVVRAQHPRGAVRRPGRQAGAGRLQRRRETDVAVFRPSTGQWFVRNLFAVQFGDPSDVPMVRIGGSQ